MQCVERGQISLDEPVERILPELSNLDIIKPRSSSAGVGGQPFTLEPSTKKITLRHLLTHTSGLTLDANKPLVAAWRASRQEGLMALSGKLIEGYVVPLSYEPGEGWSYSGGIDVSTETFRPGAPGSIAENFGNLQSCGNEPVDVKIPGIENTLTTVSLAGWRSRKTFEQCFA